jgi:hypothetical protein
LGVAECVFWAKIVRGCSISLEQPRSANDEFWNLVRHCGDDSADEQGTDRGRRSADEDTHRDSSHLIPIDGHKFPDR